MVDFENIKLQRILIKKIPLSLFQVQDAQATMRLYTMVKKHWEAEIKASHKDRDSHKKIERKPKSPKNRNNTFMGL